MDGNSQISHLSGGKCKFVILVPVNLTFQTHKSQAKEIKSSLTQKGIQVTVKPID